MATASEIVAAHRSGKSPEETAIDCLARIKAYDDKAVFISVAEESDLVAQARQAAHNLQLPLCGVPVAIKDNIDVAGLPTTAACPAFAYQPKVDATVVAKLRAAGAIIVGKTNLDQFATGLVGVRSPYGAPRNPFNKDVVPGGSSSGSAVAVSAGLVPLALGTDTAGSGRVPAGLNNIVGLKPSLGLLSTTGVVPACRSLDCVSIFSLTADDAWTALGAMAGFDERDAYSQRYTLGQVFDAPPATLIGVPRAKDLYFFDDKHSAEAFRQSIGVATALGAKIIELDFSHFLEAARLLYEGPWVAERTAAVGTFVEAHPAEIFPVTRDIIAGGSERKAVDAFKAFYRMQELRALARKTMQQVDALMVPTVPAVYTVADLESEPVKYNSNLGTYTNFVNLMDLCGLAVPSVFANGFPYGVTLLANAGEDATLLSLGRALHEKSNLTLGALGIAQPRRLETKPSSLAGIELAVVGAHMSGMALNHELSTLGAKFVRSVRTKPDYRLFLLDAPHPPRPGMLRVGQGQGTAIETEIWTMTAEAFGKFVAKVPRPLSIGTVGFEDGSEAKCFLVEAAATVGAQDISASGGWRKFVSSAG